MAGLGWDGEPAVDAAGCRRSVFVVFCGFIRGARRASVPIARLAPRLERDGGLGRLRL